MSTLIRIDFTLVVGESMPGSFLSLPGIGIDIVYIPRILKVIVGRKELGSRQSLSRFVDRILTSTEQSTFRKRWGEDDEILGDDKKIRNCAAHLAGRYVNTIALLIPC